MSESKVKFRLCRQKVGLTYSCPKSEDDNPIPNKEELLDFLRTRGDVIEYSVCEELHASGKRHYHAEIKYAEKLDVRDPSFFDYMDVHPNIIKPGKGWLNYVCKFSDHISNVYKECIFKRARDADTWSEASDLLWTNPKFMLQHGDRAERNWKRRKQSHCRDVVYFGPSKRGPDGWEPHKQALIISGPSGCGKTQWALDWARHNGYDYLKCSNYQGLKRIENNHGCLIFDDADESLNKQDYTTWISLTDVEQERDFRILHGCVSVRAMPKIFTTNSGLTPSDNSAGAVQRRIFYWDFIQ
jgi:hypothetical protein